MELTKKQEQGLNIAIQRYRNHDPYTVIAGYAGAGKSTLVQFIISALDIDLDKVAYVAYTGKAALVLKEKGCPNATTAHKLLYDSFPRKDGTFYHIPKRPLEKDYELIVVDEISMLPKEMWDLLLSHHKHVIALGDPGQLPPIGEDNGVLAEPHIFLDEIMRQAQDSEIIRLTMDIRDGKPLQLFKGSEVQILDKRDLIPDMYFWADQVIVGKNVTRHSINNLMRKTIHGVEDRTPVDGDRIICLKNDWYTSNSLGDVLVNGEQGILRNPRVLPLPYIDKVLTGDFVLEEYANESRTNLNKFAFNKLKMDYKIFSEGEPSINKDNFRRIPKQFHPQQFDYGYCITTHKSQGSEYNKVLVLEEWLKGNDHARWLYTAATRAKSRLVIIRNY